MSVPNRAHAVLRGLARAFGDAVYPEGAFDAGTRRAFQDEAAESNLVTVRWVVLFLAPLHVLIIVVFQRVPETDPRRISWIAWLVAINAALLAACAFGAVVAWRRWPAFLTGTIGEVGGALYLLGGAAMAANAQRANPNINVFVICAFFGAFRLRMRPQVFVPALLAGVAMVLGAVTHFRTEAAVRAADELTLLSVSSLSLFAFFLTRGMRLREVDARQQVQQLNAQLNEKVRERSRELSLALGRIAGDHRDLAPGTVLGARVQIEAPIGRGGMGVVYRGSDLLTGAVVAVKVVQAGSAPELDGLHRFLREAQIVASVTHPAIVRSLHLDVSEEGRLFQVMELVEGETLEARLVRRGPLSPPVAARLGAVLAEALAAAHAAHVAHLDVKPANVILTRRAKPGLKLLDFGISTLRGVRIVHAGGDGGLLGTPEFLAPEQATDPARADDRADVYTFGLVLYRCVAGRMPFDAASAPAWIVAHTQHPPLDLLALVPGIDPRFAGLVMSCLAKDPQARPTTATIAATLSALADEAGTPPLEDLDLVASLFPAPVPSATGTITQPSPLAITSPDA